MGQDAHLFALSLKLHYWLTVSCLISIIVKKLSSLKRLLRTTSAELKWQISQKDDITLQHIAKMSLCNSDAKILHSGDYLLRAFWKLRPRSWGTNTSLVSPGSYGCCAYATCSCISAYVWLAAPASYLWESRTLLSVEARSVEFWFVIRVH